jgi:hypothetical protein
MSLRWEEKGQSSGLLKSNLSEDVDEIREALLLRDSLLLISLLSITFSTYYRNDNNFSNSTINQILNNYNRAENDISTLNSHIHCISSPQ